jgi:NAD(P)-dependent dehydrogenase (short-subunit alcohol dehydrogenase family)
MAGLVFQSAIVKKREEDARRAVGIVRLRDRRVDILISNAGAEGLTQAAQNVDPVIARLPRRRAL